MPFVERVQASIAPFAVSDQSVPTCPGPQAFGKVGSPGAVVWLGYSWKDGPKHSWGSLLGQLIQGFAKGEWSREWPHN